MRHARAVTSLVLAAVVATALPAAPSGGPPRPAIEGDWEAVIDSPKRPWIFLVHFKPMGGGWSGTMTVPGLPDLPLSDIRVDSARLQFRFPAELDSVGFEGSLTNGEIIGHVLEGVERTPTRLSRVVALSRPKNHLEAWQQDLEFAGTHLLKYDRSFTPEARRAFQSALTQLQRELPRMNDAGILVALSRAVALGDNAHTRLRLDPTRWRSFSTTFPIRMWWFSDGPYVVRAESAYRRALRCRVVAIDGNAISQAREKATKLFAGNESWADYLTPIYLTSPDVLYGLGLIGSMKQASFTFEDAKGARFSLTIRSIPLDRDAMPDESWQELSPLVVTGKPPWATALAADAAASPLYLRHAEQPYWFEFLPGSGLLYFQFNHSDDAEQGPTLEQFGRSFVAFARLHPIRGVVVDLRLNSGGNLDVAKAFIQSLGREAKINRDGRLFVVIGPCTFSAGLYHAAQLKQFTRAIFVGESVGDRLDFWAEGGDIVLPNSLAVIRYSNGFHRYSGASYPQLQPYYEELSIPSLTLDISAPLSSKDYFSGRDPALEAIASRLGR